MDDPEHTVLLCAAGSVTAFQIAARLRANWGQRIGIVSIDVNPSANVSASLLTDDHRMVPPSHSQKFTANLRNICQSQNADTIQPLLNAEFSAAFSVAAGSSSCSVVAPLLSETLATSKRATADWLLENGPPTVLEVTRDQIDSTRTYFVKPNDGIGSAGSGKVSGNRLRLDGPDERWLIQPVCDGPEFTVDSFVDAPNGFARAVVRERITVKSGVCTAARLFESDEISDIARTIGMQLNQRGTICFQLMRHEGELVVTDLNFRPGAGTSMTAAAGVDLLAASFACHWGEDYTSFVERPIEAGSIVTRQYVDLVMEGDGRRKFT